MIKVETELEFKQETKLVRLCVEIWYKIYNFLPKIKIETSFNTFSSLKIFLDIEYMNTHVFSKLKSHKWFYYVCRIEY